MNGDVFEGWSFELSSRHTKSVGLMLICSTYGDVLELTKSSDKLQRITDHAVGIIESMFFTNNDSYNQSASFWIPEHELDENRWWLQYKKRVVAGVFARDKRNKNVPPRELSVRYASLTFYFKNLVLCSLSGICMMLLHFHRCNNNTSFINTLPVEIYPVGRFGFMSELSTRERESLEKALTPHWSNIAQTLHKNFFTAGVAAMPTSASPFPESMNFGAVTMESLIMALAQHRLMNIVTTENGFPFGT